MKTSKADLSAIQDQGAVQRIKDATVRLKAGAFTGSGVVLTVNPGKFAIVLTAKHNLTVQGRAALNLDEPKDWAQGEVYGNTTALMTKFKSEIRFGDPAPPPRVKFISFLKDKVDFTYDVCVLRVTPPDGLAGIYPYSDIRTQLQRSRQVLANLTANHNNLHLVQLGFGATSANGDPSSQRQHRLVKCKTTVAERFYDASVGTNLDVLTLVSSSTETTLRGDSGGPLFSLTKAPQAVVTLLALTLGADACKTEDEDEAASTKPDGHLNNTVTSLDRAYEELLNNPQLLGT